MQSIFKEEIVFVKIPPNKAVKKCHAFTYRINTSVKSTSQVRRDQRSDQKLRELCAKSHVSVHSQYSFANACRDSTTKKQNKPHTFNRRN